MARYAWIITKDHLFEPGKPVEPCNRDDAGTTGPHDAPELWITALRKGQGRAFKCYDDDGELYYSGRFFEGEDAATDGRGPLGDNAFGPLDDFAKPNAGAVRIDYRMDDGKWETL